MSHKTVLVSTRFSQTELDQIDTRSKLLGLKLSAFIRSAVFLYIEGNPEIPYKDVRYIFGADSDSTLVKSPTSFRIDDQQQLTLTSYLSSTKAKKSILVRHAAVLACLEPLGALQSRPEFRPTEITPDTSVTGFTTATRFALATCRLDGPTFIRLDAKAKATGISRSQYIERLILADLA